MAASRDLRLRKAAALLIEYLLRTSGMAADAVPTSLKTDSSPNRTGQETEGIGEGLGPQDNGDLWSLTNQQED